MNRNNSTVELLTPEEIIRVLLEKINKSDITDNYILDPLDYNKVLSQPGAKKLFDDINNLKINIDDITHEFNPEVGEILKVLSQKGAKELYDDINVNKIDFKDLTNEYNLDSPSNKKALSQDGANLLYKKVCEKITTDAVSVTDITNEFENIEVPSETKVLSQKGAVDLFNEAALKRDIVDDYENDLDNESATEKELKNKIFSLKGARSLFRYLNNNFVSKYGSAILGNLTFPINNIKNGIGIKFFSKDNEFKLYAENDLKEKALKISSNKTDLLKLFHERMEITKNSIFKRNIGVNSVDEPKYNMTIENKNGIHIENGNMVFYLNDLPIMHVSEEGLYVFNSVVSTENKPVNAVSIDIHQVEHGFNNQLVCYFEGKWKIADLKKEHTADGWAIRIDDDNFRVFFSGLVELDDTIRDDEGNKLQIGEYYFVSQDVNGALMRTRCLDGVEQIALKTVAVNNKLKGQLLLTDEANFNLLTNFNIDDNGNVSTIETLYKLIETVDTMKGDILHMGHRIEELEGVVTDYDRLYENNFVEETYKNHPFLFNAVHNAGEVWEMANLSLERIADAVAIKKDNETYILVTKGTVEIPAGASDDEGKEFISGEYYYVSHNVVGGFSRYKSQELDVDQLAFKVIKHKNKMKAIILINEEANLDY